MIWAVAWALVGVIIGLVDWGHVALKGNPQFDQLPFFLFSYASLLGVTGALCGLGFGALFSRAERDRTIRELSMSRIAVWGVLAGALVSPISAIGYAVVLQAHFPSVVFVGLLSCVSAVVGGSAALASLAVAKRGTLETAEAPRLGPT